VQRLGEAVVVVQEDLTDRDTGKSIAEVHSEDIQFDDHGNVQHGRATSFSPAIYLAQTVANKLKVEVVYGKVKEAALVPQHIQRSCMMSPIDASEAFKVGSSCINALGEGLTKKSVVLLRDKGITHTDTTELKNIAAKERSVPAEYIRGIEGPTQEFIDEYIYLVGGPAAIPHYSKGHFKAVKIPDTITKDPYIKNKK
jgi:6-phosphofructokinase